MKKQKQAKTYLLAGMCLICLILISCQLSGVDSSYETTLAALQENNQEMVTKIARQDEIISYLATRIAAAYIPTPDQYPTFTPYAPVSGSIELEGGACCAGGTAGEIITLNAAFEAASPYGQVLEMRSQAAGFSLSENDMQDAEWESFTGFKEFERRLSINWAGFYVCVQYRDEFGNISPVYCDDISLEGHPPSPTP